MGLTPGTRLGPYEIISLIGAGGMGQVYRARDTKLNRDVAVKVLPEVFATDPERLARFTREAQTLAALNHPNIAHIHGLEESPSTSSTHSTSSGQADSGQAPSTSSGQAAGVRALVMELVEGEDLSALIDGARGLQTTGSSPGAKGPGLHLQDALAIARQLTDALEAAHEQGIVHRDLKPANIKVRADGMVKVLDFGLAKALDPNASSATANAMNSPTLTAAAFAQGYGGPGTQMGMIIGTAAYMAPEQARGKAVDRRADIWAFGVVLYEMLAGRRAFHGDDISITLASVLKEDVDWKALPDDLPAPIRRLLRRCLEKDPRRRLSSIGDARLELDEAGAMADRDGASSAPASVAAAVVPLWRRALPLVATAIVVALIVAAVDVLRTPPVTPPEIVRFMVLADVAAPLFRSPGAADFALSHDGRTLAYMATRLGAPQLYLRRLDQLVAVPLAGSAAAFGPFFSPDDQWVAFSDSSGTAMNKVPVTGGAPLSVVHTKTDMNGAAWLADGTIVFSLSGSGLFAVPDSGGTPVQVTKLDSAVGDTDHLWPSAIPGTKAVLFVAASGDPLRTGHVAVLDRGTGRVVRTTLGGTAPHYLPTGHVVYATTDGSLMVAPFDATRLEVTGGPAPIAERVGVKGGGLGSFDVATDGRIAYSAYGWLNADRTLVWVDRAGKTFPMAAPPRTYFYARVSPDGNRLSLDIRDQDQDIWTWDARGTLSRVTQGPAPDQYGLWMPDGEHVLFSSTREGKQGLYRTRVDGAGAPELIVDAAGAYPNAVTPDGKQIIFRSAVGTRGQNDLFIVAVDGDHTARTLLGTEHDELNAALSPDGHWMAYQSNLSGATEIYVRPFPDVNSSQIKVSIAGGVKPAWAPNGRELFYLTPDGKMMSVPLETARGFVPGTPVALFDASGYFAQGSGRNYDVSHDGARFVMVKNPPFAEGADAIMVVLNWAADVVAKLPKSGR